jgi:hypothetical protein
MTFNGLSPSLRDGVVKRQLVLTSIAFIKIFKYLVRAWRKRLIAVDEL